MPAIIPTIMTHVLLANKKINLKYEILDTYQAGISLLGHEVKSLKLGHGNFEGSYIVIKEDRGKYHIVLRSLAIPPYQANNQSPTYNPERERALLLNRKEILAIERELHNKGTTLVPQSIGIERGRIKVAIAIVRGKKKHDKRHDIKKRDQQRDADRDSKARFK